MEEKNLSISLPTSATTHSPSKELTTISGKQVKPETTKQKVERLFLRPLRKLDEHDDGYIVLIVVLVLLEKALRVKHKMNERGENSEFYDSHPAFNDMGQILGVDREVAIRFWKVFRNGLMHRAIPKHTLGEDYELNKSGVPLKQKGMVLEVDAIAVKDVVMRHIDNESLWNNDEFAFLPDTFEPISGEVVVKYESSSENPA